jgi:hypothetical protein
MKQEPLKNLLLIFFFFSPVAFLFILLTGRFIHQPGEERANSEAHPTTANAFEK